MAKAKIGDNVKVHYTGKITNGETFDSSIEREPFQINLGSGNVIPGFEKAVIGLEVGESVTVDITPEEGYGIHHEGMVKEQNIFNENGERLLPEGIATGLTLQGTGPMGEPVNATIVEVNETTAKLDFNHVLAGKNLTFEITLVENDSVETETEVTESTETVNETETKEPGYTHEKGSKSKRGEA